MVRIGYCRWLLLEPCRNWAFNNKTYHGCETFSEWHIHPRQCQALSTGRAGLNNGNMTTLSICYSTRHGTRTAVYLRPQHSAADFSDENNQKSETLNEPDWVSKWKNKCAFLDFTWHLIGHFGDESFQAITCIGTDNSKQTRENTPKKHKKQTSLG